MKRPKLILLDWDGIVVDYFDLQVRAKNAALEAYGKPKLTLEEARVNIGESDKSYFVRTFGDKAEDAFNIFQAAFKPENIVPKDHLIDGAAELIDYLSKHKDVELTVVTNKPDFALAFDIEGLGWREKVLKTSSARDGRVDDKPSAALMDELRGDISTEDVLVIGDTNTDLAFARNSGTKFIGVGDRFAPEELNAGEHCDSIKQLLNRMKMLYPEVDVNGKNSVVR